MGRLLFLVALVLLVLIIFLVIRARRLTKVKAAMESGWFPQQLDIGNETIIKLMKYGHKGRVEARISLDDPDYSNKVIEAFSAADVKAEEWNSTRKALTT